MATRNLYLVTGGAGFIGSHIVERLLGEGHRVRVLDDFSSGRRENLAFARGSARLEVVRGDIRRLPVVERAMRGVDGVFHQAAMRSVPRSVADPLGANSANVTGTSRTRSDPRRSYSWDGSTSTTTKRSPGGPPFRPASPLPFNRTRVPVFAPAGIFTE